MTLWVVLTALLWATVTSQRFSQSGDVFPSGQTSSFFLPQPGSQIAPASVFLSGDSFTIGRRDTQRPFDSFQPQQPQKPQTATTTINNNKQVEVQKGHTYEDGTMGGDYPSHLAAKQREANMQGGTQEGHTYDDGTMGGDYPSHLVAKQTGATNQGGNQEVHRYADGAMDGNYPTRLAAKQAETNRQGAAAFQGSNINAQGTASGQHKYEDGTMGGDYPSAMAAREAQQQQQQRFPVAQFLNAQRARTNPQFTVVTNTQPLFLNGQRDKPQGTLASNKQSTEMPHRYEDGTTGGDYPSKMAAKQAQQQQQQQQQQQLAPQLGRNFPARLLTPQIRDDVLNAQANPNPIPPTRYDDDITGNGFSTGNTAQFARGVQQGSGFKLQASFPSGQQAQVPLRQSFPAGTGLARQPQVGGSSNAAAFPSLKLTPAQNPAVDFSQNQLFPPVRASADTSQRFFSDTQPRGSAQGTSVPQFSQGGPTSTKIFIPQGQGSSQSTQIPQGGGGSGKHTYADGRTGDDYPSVKAKEAGASAAETFRFPAQGGSAFGTGNAFLTSASSSPQSSRFAPQCFQYQNLADSYQLSDADRNYPMDAIISELRSNPHMARMVGYESVPEKNDAPSPFDNFADTFGLSSTSFSSFGFDKKDEKMELSNVKYFPANFDENTLGKAMPPMIDACPADTFTLRALSMDSNRCSVVNADYQDISFVKCLRRECSQCGARAPGVSACVESYAWVSVILYCPQWERNRRINAMRLYLPQGCTCNRYQC